MECNTIVRKTKNFDRIKEIKNIRNGYDCSSCDPLLIFIAWKYNIDIIHNYNGVAIYYTHDDCDFIIPFLSSNYNSKNSMTNLKGHTKNKKIKRNIPIKNTYKKNNKRKHSNKRKNNKRKHSKKRKNNKRKHKKIKTHHDGVYKHKPKIKKQSISHQVLEIKNIENIKNIEIKKYKCITFYSNSHNFW